MAKGRANTKGFAKFLPHTTQDLRHGKVTPEQVASDLKEIYSHKTLRIAGTDMESTEGISILTVMKALPANFFHKETDQYDTIVEFSSDLQSNLLERTRGHLNRENSSLLLKESLDEVCAMWASRLDKLYGITPETDDKWEQEVVSDFKHHCLLALTHNIVLGFQYVKFSQREVDDKTRAVEAGLNDFDANEGETENRYCR